jgi:hypothetical protein
MLHRTQRDCFAEAHAIRDTDLRENLNEYEYRFAEYE